MTVTQLREGDYRPDGAGGFALATGGAGVLERVLFLLTARRGGFPLLPEVGSRLYLLSRARPSARGALGASYAAEALAGEENQRVLGAVWTEETRTLTVELEWQGEPMQAVLDAAVKRVTVQADALLVELEELPLCFRVRAQAGGRGAARRVEVTECTPLPR